MKGNIMALIIPNGYEQDLAIQPQDKDRNAAQVDGVPQWSSSDPTIIEVIPAADALSAIVRTVGALGHVTVTVTADADLGAGVKTITGTIEIDVAAGEAVSLTIIEGELRPIGGA